MDIQVAELLRAIDKMVISLGAAWLEDEDVKSVYDISCAIKQQNEAGENDDIKESATLRTSSFKSIAKN